jgi:hypothetical protein
MDYRYEVSTIIGFLVTRFNLFYGKKYVRTKYNFVPAKICKFLRLHDQVKCHAGVTITCDVQEILLPKVNSVE